MSGKNQGKVREFEVDDKWQPWPQGSLSAATAVPTSLSTMFTHCV